MASYEIVGERRKSLSHLPLLRYTSVVSFLVALDCLICISLWIGGGNTKYLETNVEDFSITQSTFDLACIAAVRGVLIIASYYYLEQFIIMRYSVQTHEEQVKNTRLSIACQGAILLISAASLIYSIVKGGFLIKRVTKDQSIEMHITYKVLCITSVVFSLVEFLFGFVSLWWIRWKVRAIRLHRIINQEVDDEKPIKKKADLMRLALLAKPVSGFKVTAKKVKRTCQMILLYNSSNLITFKLHEAKHSVLSFFF